MEAQRGEHDWALDIIFGMLFAWMVYKVITLLMEFKQDQLTIVRQQSGDGVVQPNPNLVIDENYFGQPSANDSDKPPAWTDSDEPSPSKAKQETDSAVSDSMSHDESSASGLSDDEWERIGEKNLSSKFEAASLFVQTVAQGSGLPITQESKLLLYALYKQSTMGSCDEPKPSIFNLEKLAKWEAWRQLGDLKREEAMDDYVDLVYRLFPDTFDIDDGSSENVTNKNSSSKQNRPMGPVFSTMINEQEDDLDASTSPALHTSCRDGDAEKVLELLSQGTDINEKNEDGCTPLHIAVDSGKLKIVDILLSRGCNVDEKDSEGQTPLFYAFICEFREIASLLLKHGASLIATDNEGKTPKDYIPSSWDFHM